MIRIVLRRSVSILAIVAIMNLGLSASLARAEALAASKSRHKRTRPYRPQTNGKVERYHRAMATEWLYAKAWTSNDERHAALTAWLDYYNYDRPHSSLGGKTPISRCTRPTDNNLAA